jgi:thiol peroxidase
MVAIQAGDNTLTLAKEPVNVGEQLPNVTLATADGSFNLADLSGKVSVVSVVPNVNTGTCTLQTRYFNQQADQFSDVNWVTISTNTPEEQTGWCAAEGVDNLTLLSDQDHAFGEASGLYIGKDLFTLEDADNGFDTRAVFVVDANGTIVYRQIVPVLGDEPEYEPVLAAVRDALA